MSSLFQFLRRRTERVVDSIAFWPTVLGLAFVLLAVALRSFSTEAFIVRASEAAPFLFVQDRTVSLSLLTTLIGGIISLMVFSFSMVMVLLSNASANLTPRLLPSLIESTRHQVVLGFYLGTLLYCIIIAMGFGVAVDGDTPPSLAVALAVGFGFACLALFIYFIHGVSRSIQVGVVLEEVHQRTMAGLARQLGEEEDTQRLDGPFPELDAWHVLPAWRSGFVQGIAAETLAAFAKTHHTALAFVTEPGSYVVAGEPLLYCERALSHEALASAQLRRGVFFGGRTEAFDYYGAGLERTVEVALKALSPGINDPGTAVEAIERLRDVFAAATATVAQRVVRDDADAPRFYQRLPPWTELLERHLAALQAYGREDPQTQAALRRLRKTLLLRLAERPSTSTSVAQLEHLFRGRALDTST